MVFHRVIQQKNPNKEQQREADIIFGTTPEQIAELESLPGRIRRAQLLHRPTIGDKRVPSSYVDKVRKEEQRREDIREEKEHLLRELEKQYGTLNWNRSCHKDYNQENKSSKS